MQSLPRMLIVEDDRKIATAYVRMFRRRFECHVAVTLALAREEFLSHHGDFAVILLDGALEGSFTAKEAETVPLARWFRTSGCNALMVAVSGKDEYRRQLIEAGCDGECGKTDIDALKALIDARHPT